MRIKFLSAILSFLLVSFAMSSCLGDDEPVEYSSNALVQAFELNSVLGVKYSFTIDQMAGKIYNQDSLPVGSDTIIDRILITKLTTASGYILLKSASNEYDSIFSIADSVNLTGTMRAPFKFKVFAPDGIHSKMYSLEVRVHQVHPDSLTWGTAPIATNYAPGIGRQKAVLLGEQIFVYAENNATHAYTASTHSGTMWSEISVNLPADFKASSIVNFENVLYVATESGNVYSSEDAITWRKHDTLSNGSVVTLIASFPASQAGNNLNKTIGIAGILRKANKLQFSMSDATANHWQTTSGDTVTSDFPTNNISCSVFTNNIGVRNAILVGNSEQILSNDTATVAWGSTDGLSWNALITESKYTCPKLIDPSIIYYGNAFYIFGKDFKQIYKSEAGLVWNETKSKFMLPKAIRDKKSDYSMVVDQNNYIWIMRNEPNEVWRGKLNRLGFKVLF